MSFWLEMYHCLVFCWRSPVALPYLVKAMNHWELLLPVWVSPSICGLMNSMHQCWPQLQQPLPFSWKQGRRGGWIQGRNRWIEITWGGRERTWHRSLALLCASTWLGNLTCFFCFFLWTVTVNWMDRLCFKQCRIKISCALNCKTQAQSYSPSSDGPTLLMC